MSVFNDTYARASSPINANQIYTFDWEWIGAENIEVYEITDLGVRTRVAVQDYTLETRTQITSPTKGGGTVTFNRAHASNIASVEIERNTLIVSNFDYPVVDSFENPVIETSLDYLTLILQEINDRKCSSGTGITQLLNFGDYRRITAENINNAIDKLTAIALDIDIGGEDCRGQPENV